MDYDQTWWERRWQEALRTHGDRLAQKPPNPHLVEALTGHPPGRALDAGCGHGAETLWLAGHGWEVTAVDFSVSALTQGRALAEAAGFSPRVTWLEGDLSSWRPAPGHFDLVLGLHVHIAGDVDEWVRRMAEGVAPGGQLLLVGHQPRDPSTGAPTAAAGQVQVSVAAARAALDATRWTWLVAEERPRTTLSGVDAVLHARKLG